VSDKALRVRNDLDGGDGDLAATFVRHRVHGWTTAALIAAASGSELLLRKLVIAMRWVMHLPSAS
jgi:hypothetical protein